MLVLFSFAGGRGHLTPLLPLARAARDRGHDVRITGQSAMLDVIRGYGFRAYDSGGRTLVQPDRRLDLQPLDRAHEEDVIATVFAGTLARERAAKLVGLLDEWTPDVVVRDEMDFAAAVVAERFDLPHAAVVVLAAGGLVRPDLIATPLNALRAEHGLPVDDDLGRLDQHLTLVPAPPSFRTPLDPVPATARHIRPAVIDPFGDGSRTSSTTGDLEQPSPNRRPAVYFTLGTVFHQESGDLFHRVVRGLGDLDADITVTVGSEIDPAELGSPPRNVRIERFIPAAEVLSRSDAVVCHAGSGTVIGALAFGVPMVLAPMGADQPWTADRCVDLQVGVQLDAITAQPDDFKTATQHVLFEGTYRRNAERLAAEMAQLPDSTTALGWLEKLVTD